MPRPLPNWAQDVEELKRFSRVSFVVADLDGTLVPSRLADKIQGLIRSLHHHRYRVTFTIATGRTLTGAKPLIDRLMLPKDAPLILYNGSLVLVNGSFKVLLHETIPLESLKKTLELCSRYRVRTFGYFYDENWFEPESVMQHEYVIGWASNCGPIQEFNNMPVQWINNHNLDQFTEPSSILIDTTCDPEAAATIEIEVAKIADISITRSGDRYVEVRPEGSNKGVALASVANKCGIAREEILALGDNDNDSEMLAWAGVGVAIAEASRSAMDSSDYLCRYGVFEGAVEVLNLVRHARRYFFHPHLKDYAEFTKDGPHGTMGE
jgi:Cof subfamily protein (haloacid dehalogenase superfamily)